MTQNLRQKIIKGIITLLSLTWGVTAILAPTSVYSQKSVCDTFGPENCAKDVGVSVTPGKDAQNKVESFLLTIANVLMFFAAIACVIFIIIGGYILITSNGGSDAQKKGRSYIVNALVGLIVILLAKLIVELTIGTLQGFLASDANK